MIDLNFGLFWSGAPLSYLRYLTFKTLRYHHPDAKIELYVSMACDMSAKWGIEKQDFQVEDNKKCYLSELHNLDIDIIEIDQFKSYPPNFQSDFFRWWWLKEKGGFYLDTDQIILKPFDSIPLDASLICSIYKAKSCGIYAPVGVIGANKDSEIVDWINKLIPQFYKKDDYNSIGPTMFRTVMGMREWNDKVINASSEYFYPIPDSYLVPTIYDGSFRLSEKSVALHWYGGHPASQEFNNKYTEEFSHSSDDVISTYLRGIK
tara:strand:+ start:14945 stop:15730 length:786 start_codon:yes stop_codon:yes gene_type:complete